MTQTIESATPHTVESSRRGRGFLAVTLSMLLPGLGHWAAGARRRAIGWFIVWGVAVVGTLGAMSFERTVPALLVFVPVLLLVQLGVWIDAYRMAHKCQLPRPASPIARYGLGLFILPIVLYAHPAAIVLQYWKLPTVEGLFVPGAAMQPTLVDGDRILNHKLLQPQRWDVAVYYPPVELGPFPFVGRLVGLPGDTLEMNDGVLHINGQPAMPPPHVQGVTLEVSIPRHRFAKSFVLSEDEYLMLGDNSSVAHDSRYFGPVKREALRGRATWIYWPLSRMGRIK